MQEAQTLLTDEIKDSERLHWLLEDHDDVYVRIKRNQLLERMPVMSYYAATRDIDAAILAQQGAKHG